MTTSIRDKLNDKKVGFGVAAAMLLLAGCILTYYFISHATEKPNVNTAYYSDDDGQTYFVDSLYKFPPFDHGGKTAVQAILAESNGHKFVGYLKRFKPAAQTQLQQKYDDEVKNGIPPQKDVLALTGQLAGEMQVKLPGSGNPWIPSAGVGKLDVKSPSGDIPDRYIDQP